jgi:hypothetical protein
MTDLISASQGAAQLYSGDPANEASYGARTADPDRRQTGRHRAAEEPRPHGLEDAAVGADQPTTLATLLPGGVGAAAFHAAIHAARTSVSRLRIERPDDDRIAETGHGRPTHQAGP